MYQWRNSQKPKAKSKEKREKINGVMWKQFNVKMYQWVDVAIAEQPKARRQKPKAKSKEKREKMDGVMWKEVNVKMYQWFNVLMG